MADQRVEVAVGALRQEAGVWAAQAGELKALSSRASGLTMSGIQGGVFFAMVGAHNKVSRRLTEMCGSAAATFNEIGTTLKAAAKTYETEDRNRAHEFRKLY